MNTILFSVQVPQIKTTAVRYPKDVAKDNARKFAMFNAVNHHVYSALEQMSLQMRRGGYKKISIRLLYNLLRAVNSSDLVKDSEDLALSNDFTSFYARALMAKNPELVGFFDIKDSAYHKSTPLTADEVNQMTVHVPSASADKYCRVIRQDLYTNGGLTLVRADSLDSVKDEIKNDMNIIAVQTAPDTFNIVKNRFGKVGEWTGSQTKLEALLASNIKDHKVGDCLIVLV